MERIIVTGIPGVGKSTVLSKALEGLESSGKRYDLVNFGDLMESIARELYDIEIRDDIRKLPVSDQRKIQKVSAQKIAENKGNVIVDTHCTIKTKKGFLPGLPEDILKVIMPSAIVLIETDPGEIHSRRIGDKTRVRDADPESDIILHQELNRSAAMSYCALTNATLSIIRNEKGSIETAAKALRDVLL